MAVAGDSPAAARGVQAPGYKDLVRDSLKATSMDHGMQYSSIYWETSHRTYLPFWASLTQKFSWKIMDDQIRTLLRLPKPVTHEPFVFASGSPYIRRYFGDADISQPVPLQAPAHFAFVASGTRAPWEESSLTGPQAAAKRGAAATTFRAVLESAWKCDAEDELRRAIDAHTVARAANSCPLRCPLP